MAIITQVPFGRYHAVIQLCSSLVMGEGCQKREKFAKTNDCSQSMIGECKLRKKKNC
jgi:hypothetical protein